MSRCFCDWGWDRGHMKSYEELWWLTLSQPATHIHYFYFPLRQSMQKWWQDKGYSAIKLSPSCVCAVGRDTAPGPTGRTKPLRCLLGKAWIKSAITDISESSLGFGGASFRSMIFRKHVSTSFWKSGIFKLYKLTSHFFYSVPKWLVRSSSLSLKM